MLVGVRHKPQHFAAVGFSLGFLRHPNLRELPVGDCDYPTRWMLIKAGLSRRIPKDERRNKSRIAKGERGTGTSDVLEEKGYG
jgi:hypothetical protein